MSGKYFYIQKGGRERIFTWDDKIKEWENGIPLKYPKDITKTFYYLTSVCDKNLLNPYKELFINAPSIDRPMNFKPYNEYLDYPNDKIGRKNSLLYNCDDNVCIFDSISTETTLIIPRKRYKNRGKIKNFTTIKDFIDNASHNHQVHFWKKVAEGIKNFLKTHDRVYVNTHGKGVAYFHLRLEQDPKYFIDKHNFIKDMNDSI